MSNDFETWAHRYPQAATELINLLTVCVNSNEQPDGSEAKVQQQIRFDIAKAGAMAWRNNVGATPAKCKSCGAPAQPVRYGLANDSQKVNEKIKSSDLIVAIPRQITQEMVGTIIAQFGSIEVKPPGWKYTGKGREPAQAAWLALIKKLGGYATFSTGDVNL